MHSSLPQQLSNFQFSRSTAALRADVVGRAARGAALARRHRHLPAAQRGRARRRPARCRSVLIENAPGSGDRAGGRRRRRACARSGASRPTRRSCSTPGTFEAYQGLDLLLRGDRPGEGVAARRPRPARRRRAGAGRGRAGSRRAPPASTDVVVFTGQRPSEEIPAFLDAATLLVSPRSRGTNTPLKIYQYLRAGPADRRDPAAHAHPGPGR